MSTENPLEKGRRDSGSVIQPDQGSFEKSEILHELDAREEEYRQILRRLQSIESHLSHLKVTSGQKGTMGSTITSGTASSQTVGTSLQSGAVLDTLQERIPRPDPGNTYIVYADETKPTEPLSTSGNKEKVDNDSSMNQANSKLDDLLQRAFLDYPAATAYAIALGLMMSAIYFSSPLIAMAGVGTLILTILHYAR